MRFLFRFSYNGVGFYGLVAQPGLLTVQYCFDIMFSYVGVKEFSVYFISRTDKHVSAHDQVAVVSSNTDLVCLYRRLCLTLKRFTKGRVMINSIVNIGCKTIDVIGKVYVYKLLFSQSAPFCMTHHCVAIDYSVLNRFLLYMHYLSGREFDYSLFCKQRKYNRTNPVQRISIRCNLLLIHGYMYELEIFFKGKSFMYKQIRALVGTIMNIAINLKFSLSNLTSGTIITRYLCFYSAEPLTLVTILFSLV